MMKTWVLHLAKSWGVKELEGKIRSNSLSPSLSMRDDTDAIKRSPSLFKEGRGEFKVRFNAFYPFLSKRDDTDEGLR